MRYLTAAAIWLFFKLGGRPFFNKLQRRYVGEHKAARTPIPSFQTPEEIERFARQNGYEWREDSGRLGGFVFPLDWVSEPEVFQRRLELAEIADGDCDDYHAWFAHALRQLPDDQRIGVVYLCSIGYRKDGKRSGHTTAAFQRGSHAYGVDYSIRIVSDLLSWPSEVVKRRSDGNNPRPDWAVIEDADGRAVWVQDFKPAAAVALVAGVLSILGGALYGVYAFFF